MSKIGGMMYLAEQTFGGVWSVGELAVMATRVEELRHDPHRLAVHEDIQNNGFYVPLPASLSPLKFKPGGLISGMNPYRRIGDGKPDKIVAKLIPARDAAARKHLVVMMHCYGLPIPRLMERLFGLHQVAHADVVYNIMNNHQRGSFPAWPGTGFVSGRLSHFIENLRASITGVRALIQELVRERGYETVTVIGYSIGGNLAMHVANSAPIHHAILYCPVTSLHNTAGELGLMKVLQSPVSRAIKVFKPEFDLDDLKQADPLNHDLGIGQNDLHVIVQKYDALAPVRQIRAIRAKYPDLHWHEYGGTHIYPAGLAQFQRVIADVVNATRD